MNACYLRVMPLALLAVLACDDGLIPPARNALSPAAIQIQRDLAEMARDATRPPEAPQRYLAERIPGFGGYYWEGGDLVVRLRDAEHQHAARSILRDFLEARAAKLAHVHGDRPIEIAFEPADYEFESLRGWRDALAPHAFATEGVVSLSLDERLNRVRVGLREMALVTSLESTVFSLGIPRSALVFEEAAFQPDLTLQQFNRPIQGGYQIERESGGFCTLWANALRSGVVVWLTASHCTPTPWSTDFSDWYQAEFSDTSYAGYESYDPAGSDCGWFTSDVCRNSDAAVMTRPSHIDHDLGYIARTTGLGSITINSSSPRFAVVDQILWPERDWQVAKIGRSTGWTEGEISDDCIDVAASASEILICQVEATYDRQGGDSGAPVFGGPQSGQVVMYGLHSGTIGPGRSIFSPLGGIIADLGSMDATTQPSGGPGGGGDCEDENGDPIPC